MVVDSRLKNLSYLLVILSSIPVAWLFSQRTAGRALSEYVYWLTQLWVPPILLTLLLALVLSFGYYLLSKSLLKTLGLQFLVYLLPSLGGIPIRLVGGYTLGALVFSITFLSGRYIEWLMEDWEMLLSFGADTEELRVSAMASLMELLLPIPLGLGYFVLLFYWSSGGKLFGNPLPFYLLLPFLLGAAVAVAVSFADPKPSKEKETFSETFLILRTQMVVGDSFTRELLNEDDRSITLGLIGGTPVRRPVLMKLKWTNRIPNIVVLRSPWESSILVKKKEWVEKGRRYVLFINSEVKSRAPSSQDTSSAPLSAPRSLFPLKQV
ncbi:hypothetical protein [Thermococcus sp. ES12]|uniref:hypothetical protein n=1 Tax=Thermococcus sp. ES12 TaxID=1638246 RepID=UPI00142F735B|nr:hypothetical protein [Thermococcus sp. ES12]NJE77361.1 hypothetical protein [Thermococcus sp. ES12]